MQGKLFRFGDGCLDLECDEPECSALFADLYGACAVDRPADPSVPTIRCSVRAAGPAGMVHISFGNIPPFDMVGFALSLFEQMDCRRALSPDGVWETVESDVHPGLITFSGSRIRADARSPWRWLISMLALHLVIRAQPGVLFLHAGSVGLAGRGVLLVGATNSGKTTLALALADRGHAFLGDDYAAVRLRTGELLPLRRRLSIRPGPCAPGVRRTLAARAWPTRTLADGSVRYLLPVDALSAVREVPPVVLGSIVFLGERQSTPSLEPLPASRGVLKRLTPFASTFQSANPGAVAVRMARLTSQVPSYLLKPGEISHTARLIETLGEDG